MRRISASGLRFPLLVYVSVHSRREIRAFLELLVSIRFKLRTVSVSESMRHPKT